MGLFFPLTLDTGQAVLVCRYRAGGLLPLLLEEKGEGMSYLMQTQLLV